ncbi:hypothetical protein WUBG_03056 [Wuchereria bancrofti]|uniref:Uncharacterized protein n=1 Tax=Wuchereria bancrofti TaxID=6293 RepID=J9EV43_WUCBA|nr:hypothetical protein WUBG_03056 [Wuchereria bancrofti]VDM19268.1 unnamed protein product [Wuchereria bancrofti]
MEGERRCKESSLNKRKIKGSESSPKRKKCEVAQPGSSVVVLTAQQQINYNIDQDKNVKRVQGAPDSKGNVTNFGNQRTSKHFPTLSYSLHTTPIAIVSSPSAVISSVSSIVKRTSNKATRIPFGRNQDISGNQEPNRCIRDLSGDKVAVGELNGRISVAVPGCRERLNDNRKRSNGFRTPLQSPTLYVKHCNDLLMAPKKRRCTRSYRMTKVPMPRMLRSPR